MLRIAGVTKASGALKECGPIPLPHHGEVLLPFRTKRM